MEQFGIDEQTLTNTANIALKELSEREKLKENTEIRGSKVRIAIDATLKGNEKCLVQKHFILFIISSFKKSSCY